MRVGLVCPYSWDVPGGVRSHVADLAVALQDHGHDISVLAPVEDPADLPPWVVDGGRPLAVRYNGSVARLSFGVKATRRVRQWVREGDFDVLHVHEPVAPSLSILALWVAARRGFDVIQLCNPPDVIFPIAAQRTIARMDSAGVIRNKVRASRVLMPEGRSP